MAARMRIAAKLPASAMATIVAMRTTQSKGNAKREATPRPTRGITMPSMGPMMHEKSIATPNASSIFGIGVRQLTPL